MITIPAVSIARELWRLGEPHLAARALELSPAAAADIGQRAGELQQSGRAAALWPDGPRGVTPAVMLAVIEHLEGEARPCRRNRRLPEKSLPEELRVTEDQRWAAIEPVSRIVDARMHGRAD